jgi:hypothetical protein
MAVVGGTTLSIIGVSLGQTSAIIKDSSFPIKTVTVNITINAAGTPPTPTPTTTTTNTENSSTPPGSTSVDSQPLGDVQEIPRQYYWRLNQFPPKETIGTVVCITPKVLTQEAFAAYGQHSCYTPDYQFIAEPAGWYMANLYNNPKVPSGTVVTYYALVPLHWFGTESFPIPTTTDDDIVVNDHAEIVPLTDDLWEAQGGWMKNIIVAMGLTGDVHMEDWKLCTTGLVPYLGNYINVWRSCFDGTQLYNPLK